MSERQKYGDDLTDFLERCYDCGKVHAWRPVPDRRDMHTWESPDDGHAYRRRWRVWFDQGFTLTEMIQEWVKGNWTAKPTKVES